MLVNYVFTHKYSLVKKAGSRGNLNMTGHMSIRTLAKFSCENHVLRNVVNSILLGKKVKRASYVAMAAPGH